MTTSGNSGKKPVVRAGRRRKSGATPPGGRERAAAPRREGSSDQTSRPAAQQPQYPQSQQPQQPQYQQPQYQQQQKPQPTSSGGSVAGSLLQMLLGGGATRSGGQRRFPPIVLILFACIAIYMLTRCGGGLSGLLGGDTTGQQDAAASPWEQAAVAQPTATPAPLVPAAPVAPTVAPTVRPYVAPAGGQPSSWLVMLYQDADDKILEQDIYVDLNEAERVGSTANVQIVAQVDRFAGGFAGDGDWTGTRRYHVMADNDLTRVGSDLVADLGEVNMADHNTLTDFVTWAVETYPADKHVLIMSDHGMGWPGGWSDPAPATVSRRDTPLAAAAGNQLYLHELDAALKTVRERTGVDRFELIGLDACLMGQVEVFSVLANHANYAVASEEVEPALGWAYASFLQALNDNPAMSGGDLGRLIIDSYIVDDQRIVDDGLRADLMRQSSPLGGLFGFSVPTSDQMANQMGRDVTLSAVDLRQMPNLINAINNLSLALQGADQRAVAKARNYALAFTNVFSQEHPSPYVDLGHLMQLLQQANAGGNVNSASREVLSAMQGALVAETHGPGKKGATGMAIYYPNSTFYRTPATGPASYTVVAQDLSTKSLWDDFLAYHYTGRTFQAGAQQPVVPSAGATVAAPGLGAFSMSPVQASANVAAPGQPVLLSAELTGDNIGHVMLFAGYYDRAANSLYVADTDFLEAADTREVDGVFYPVWPTTGFTLEFEWEPIAYYLSDGVDAVPALLSPASYGATDELAVYTVDGVYTYASGETVRARLYLQDGMLRKVFGFVGDAAASAPREIHPQSGDSFTVYNRWLDLDNQGRVVKQAAQEGGTLTFRNEMFSWVELDAAAGDYVVGFIAQDLDGNKQQSFAQVTVR